MRPLWQHRTALQGLRLQGCVEKQKRVGRAGEGLRRRREIARVAGVDLGPVPRRIDHVHARAELVGVDELPHLIEAEAIVECQLLGQLPFVLQVEPGDPPDLADRVDNADRGRTRIAGSGIDRQHPISAGDVGLLAAANKARPQGMSLIESISGIALHAVDECPAKLVGRDTVEDDVALRIRCEVHAVVAGKVGELGVVLQG